MRTQLSHPIKEDIITNLTLAQRVRQEATGPVRIRKGVTNGLSVVHVQTLDSAGNSIDSRTLKSVAEWTLHPLHPSNLHPDPTPEVIPA